MAPGDEVTVIMNSAVARRLTVYSVQPKLPPPYPWTFNVAVYGTPYAFRFDDEGQTWARGWDTEDARALEATVLLTASAR